MDRLTVEHEPVRVHRPRTIAAVPAIKRIAIKRATEFRHIPVFAGLSMQSIESI
jgi:hypothetical protein